MDTALAVLVPRKGTWAETLIDKGSGIVADVEIPGDTLMVYYEGNRYGASNLRRWDQRVACAAGRLRAKYPTIARGEFPRADFHIVGTFHDSLTVLEPMLIAGW